MKKRDLCQLLFLSITLLSACDGEGLGRPVVSQGRGMYDPGRDCTRRAPRCTDMDTAPEEVTAGVVRDDLPACELSGASASGERITAVLRDCTLSLAAAPGEIEQREIVASALDNVRVDISGAVHLRIADSQLFRVSLTAEGAEGEPRGSLQVTHTDVRACALNADELEIISSFFWRSSVESRELSAIDMETADSLLSADVAVFAACRLRATHIGQCDTLLIAESKLTKCRIDACAGVTRLYDVEGDVCTIDGELESDLTTLVDSRFGVRDFTQFHAWNTTIDNGVLCDAFDNIRFSAGALTCVTCQGPLAQPNADACVANEATSTDSNTCEVLNDLPICEEFPRRPRPFTGF